jgi:hypothetical protein
MANTGTKDAGAIYARRIITQSNIAQWQLSNPVMV